VKDEGGAGLATTAVLLLLLGIIAIPDAAAEQTQREVASPRIVAKNERTVQALVAALTDENRDVRARAAWSLGLLQRRDLTRHLLDRLTDPAPEVQLAAILALGPGSDAAAVEALRGIFQESRNLLVRQAALEGLTAIRPPELASVLRAAAADANLRLAAVSALGEGVDGVREEALLALLDDSDLRVRRRALVGLASLWRINPPADSAALMAKIRPHLEAHELMVRAAACEVLGSLPTEAVLPLLLQRLSDPSHVVRRAATRSLGVVNVLPVIKTGRLVDPLVTRLNDEDYTVRQAAAEALGTFTPSAAAEPLAARLEDKAPEVREAAAMALASYTPEVAMTPVIARLSGSDMVETRRKAAWVIAEWGSPAVGDAAVAALADVDYLVRTLALRALRRAKDLRAVPYALRMLAWQNREKVSFEEMMESYRVAQDFRDARFIPPVRQRLEIGLRWAALIASETGPPTSLEDVRAAIITAGHLQDAALLAMVRKLQTMPEFQQACAEAVAAAEGRPYEPPPPPPPATTRLKIFFITCQEP